MFGIVGKVKISYVVSGETYEEYHDLSGSKEIELTGAKGVKFRVEEINYIEDTIYGATLSIVGNNPIIDEYFIGNDKAEFEIPERGLTGTMELVFFN